MRRFGRLLRTGLALAGAGLVLGCVLYFSSDYFRTWVRRPSYMYKCKIEQGLPDSVCLAGAAVKDFFTAKH